MMADGQSHSDQPGQPGAALRGLWPRRWRWRLSLIALVLLVLTFAVAWFQREQIAAGLIDDTLEQYGVEARYEIESIGPNQQVISNLVVGDPSAPDLTAEQVRVDIAYVFGSPQIGRVELVRPRLYGTLQNGEFSLGALDPLLFAESEEPAGLPAIDIAIRDGRALVESDFGAIAAKLDGEGRLDDGFEGMLAATAPGIGTQRCKAASATAYGNITTSGGRAVFDGPVRLRSLDCNGASVQAADVATRLALAEDFRGIDGTLALSGDTLEYGVNEAANLGGNADFFWRSPNEREVGRFVLNHDVTLKDLKSAIARVEEVDVEGAFRAFHDLSNGDWDASLEGKGVDLALGEGAPIADAREAAKGTLAQSLLAKLERGLDRSLSGGSFAANGTLRMNEEGVSALVPEARLRSAGGDTILALSRVSYAGNSGRFSGNILTGGPDLPEVRGRMEQAGIGDLALRLTMAEYRAGADAVAIPRMELRQDRRGRIAFDGTVMAEGSIPGGSVRNLAVPIEGTYSASAGLELGRRCTALKFAELIYSELELSGQTLSLCPAGSRSMLTYKDGLQFAARTLQTKISGEIAGSRLLVTADRGELRYSGEFALEGLTAIIGPDDNAVRMTAGSLSGTLSEGIGGTFEDGTAAIDAVALDLYDLSGNWAYDNGVLSVGEGAFTLMERTGGPGLAPEARINPLIANGARLTLEGNAIRAKAGLRHPATRTLVTEVEVEHDLAAAQGQARINVDTLRFSESFQPDDLSYLTKGVIAEAEGAVSGTGMIRWNGSDIDSSGRFATDDFDFAAAFGPVKGVKGEIEFTDLLNLTTAPAQVLSIASVNPGIEAFEGRIVYSITGGEVIALEDARWPFMGGELILRPTEVSYGGAGGQNYIFELVALDAATFITQMELTNIGATGTFDGTIPIYFDEDGNGFIQSGLLIARPPGGNVAYVGELTYEDLGTMGNYAFQTLRSLDYRQMSVELDGNLAGEIITRFQIDGVRQGEGASQNFITRRLAQLPIRFKINVRSDNFYTLALIVRGLFDPASFASVVDPELLGIGAGTVRVLNPEPEPEPEKTSPKEPVGRRDEPAVQPPESDDLP